MATTITRNSLSTSNQNLINSSAKGTSHLHAAAVNGEKSVLTKLILSGNADLDSGDKFGRTPLMYCVLADRIECAELIIKAGADVNKKDVGGRTSMHWAAHKGSTKFIKLLLSKGASWQEKDNEGQTALHLATRHKSSKCLVLLIRQLEPGEVDDQDNNKRTALHWSASYGHLEHVRMLIKQDSNIGIPDVERKTPLHWAASSSNPVAVDCVRVILDTTPSVINWQDFEGCTALHLAVAEGNIETVKALTSLEECNVSALDNLFRTPLHWAAVLGHPQISGILLDKKADFSSSDSNGATPLHYAAQNNYAETVEAFLSRKNLTDDTDVEGRTVLMWASSKGADQVIHVLIKYKADLSLTDKQGGSVLHAAALAGHASTVSLLIRNGVSVEAVDVQKHTPLFRACEMGHMDVVQVLINAGSKVSVVDQDGRTPLHWSALGGHAAICQKLIKFGVDPNVKDHVRRTPLQCAAYGGYVNCMSVLIEHKADPNGQDNEGMTALHWACSKGHLDAVKLLIEHHAFPNHMEFTEDRYTPLDYALMGDHHEVAQFMIEQSGLSITGIQEIAACKIQAAFRGFRVRKIFQERKNLLMKHEQLMKDAAKKRACEPQKQRDSDNKNSQTGNKSKPRKSSKTETDKVSENICSNNNNSAQSSSTKAKGVSVVDNKEILQARKDKRQVVSEERKRLKEHRRKVWAARIIQRAWRGYVFKTRGFLKTAKEAIHEKRLQAGENEWNKQIAALTIQLAWRKYYRKKLLKSLPPSKRKLVQKWDPAVVECKQKALVKQIYSEYVSTPEWHPKVRPAVRPLWARYMPSAASMSYNFAVGQYQHLPPEQQNKEEIGSLKLSDGSQARHFSYNMQS